MRREFPACARRGRHGRAGVSMIELAVVLAIIGIFAGLAGSMMNELIPSWRTRRAARMFSADVIRARHLAIAENVEYRIRLSAFDTDLDGTSGNIGTWYLERGNLESGSTSWDILPVDLDGSGTLTGEGTVDISEGGEDELRDVSLEEWGAPDGAIVFSPRGWLTNEASDFDTLGYINVTFVNKAARQRGGTDEWTALVSRGGLVRLQATINSPVGSASGVGSTSTSGTGTGYAGGGGGGSGSGEI